MQRPGIGPGHQATLQRLQLTAAAFQNPFGATNQYMPVRLAGLTVVLCTCRDESWTSLAMMLLLLIQNWQQRS